jgi:hypothetical protein
VWKGASPQWISTWISIGSGGSINTNSYIPNASAIQITAYAYAGNYCCGNTAFAAINGRIFSSVAFDTVVDEFGLLAVGTTIISPGLHSFSITSGTSNYHGDAVGQFYISGYLR